MSPLASQIAVCIYVFPHTVYVMKMLKELTSISIERQAVFTWDIYFFIYLYRRVLRTEEEMNVNGSTWQHTSVQLPNFNPNVTQNE